MGTTLHTACMQYLQIVQQGNTSTLTERYIFLQTMEYIKKVYVVAASFHLLAEVKGTDAGNRSAYAICYM